MNRRFFKFFAFYSLAFFLLFPTGAFATSLPSVVMQYLRGVDPQVKVRFDGVVTFPNGETYLPVLPQDPEGVAPTRLILKDPETTQYPDLVEFDNHFFLLRLVTTSSGKKTFVRKLSYPIALKEGLFPQDLVIPANLFIPAELKVLLGALPYQPGQEEIPVVSPEFPAVPSLPETVGSSVYLADLSSQSLRVLNPSDGSEQAKISLSCVPSSITPSVDQKWLFIPCLTSNELVVVDTHANLVRTRVPVGQRPTHAIQIPVSGEVWVSNRYEKTVSIVSGTDFATVETVTLPSTVAQGVLSPQDPGHLYLADGTLPKVYVLNLQTRQIERTLQGLPNLSSLWMAPDGKELWVASRSAHQVSVVQLPSGKPLKTFDVGQKPVAVLGTESRVFVVCAQDDRVEVIDRNQQVLLKPIPLPGGSFPSSMVLGKEPETALVSFTGATGLTLLDLKTSQAVQTFSNAFRGISMTSFHP